MFLLLLQLIFYLEVSEFELKSRYYVCFQFITLGKSMSSPALG